MTDDGWLNRLIAALNLYPNLNTRTRYPTAETRDLKTTSPAIPPVSGFPLIDCVPNRQHLNWVGSALRADLAASRSPQGEPR